MAEGEIVSLLYLKSGRKGQIVQIGGGRGLQLHLDSMGIRRGKIVQKVAVQPLRGPVVIELDGSAIAIGRGIADKILVKEIASVLEDTQ